MVDISLGGEIIVQYKPSKLIYYCINLLLKYIRNYFKKIMIIT
jgi:hypothetical protein